MAVEGEVSGAENHDSPESGCNSRHTTSDVPIPKLKVTPIAFGPLVVEKDENVHPPVQTVARKLVEVCVHCQ